MGVEKTLSSFESFPAKDDLLFVRKPVFLINNSGFSGQLSVPLNIVADIACCLLDVPQDLVIS